MKFQNDKALSQRRETQNLYHVQNTYLIIFCLLVTYLTFSNVKAWVDKTIVWRYVINSLMAII